jgi:uncharacterized protein
MWLATAFFLIALLYASVGFGGGSSYSALLAWAGEDYKLVPLIALMCNIIVVAGGFFRYLKADLYDWRQVWPPIAVSAPLAFIGGYMPIKETTFYFVLSGVLLLSSCALMIPMHRIPKLKLPYPALLSISSLIGLLAGLSGIGGGIFMSPLLHLVQWSEARRIAAFATIFILINSITGIGGQVMKNGGTNIIETATPYWPLFLAVFVGGQVGGYVGSRIFSAISIRRLTAILVGYVAITLLIKGWNLLS